MERHPIGDPRLLRPAGVFVCVAVGLCIGRWFAPPSTTAGLIGVASALIGAFALRAPWRWALLALALVSAGAAWWDVRIEHSPSAGLLEAVERLERRAIVHVEGTVAETPRVEPIARGVFAEHARRGVTTRFRLDDIRFQDDNDATLRGALWVSVGGRTGGVRAGDRVSIWGRLAPGAMRRNPGDPPYRLRALERGGAAFLSVPTVGNIEVLGVGSRVARLRAGVRARATAWLSAARERDDAASALLLAALVGDRVEALHSADSAVRRVGAAHLLAISGLHLTFLVTLFVFGARAFKDPGRAEPLLGAGLALAYLALTPARAPIVRAAVLTVALMAGEAAGTRWRREALLAWAATLTVLWRPTELFSPGFQLSYACVTALVMFTTPTRERLFRERRASLTTDRWFARTCKNALASTFVAWLVATPLLAHHFGVINPLGVLVVLLVTPVFTAVLALGFVTSVLSLISVALGEIIAPGALYASGVFLSLVHALDRLPAVVFYTPALPLALTIGVTSGILWWLWRPRRAWATIGAVSALSIAIGAWLWRAHETNGLARDVALRVDMLDVGDGSFFILRSGRETLIWDAGSQNLAFARRAAPASLRALGVWRAPEVVITHPNLDHFSALPDLAHSVGVRRVRTSQSLLDDASDPSSASVRLLDELGDLGVVVDTLVAGDALNLGAARGDVLWPPEGATFEDANNTSVVLRLTVNTALGERSVLLTGDIEPDAARAILDANPDLQADVLELPHHGSARLAGAGFAERLAPSVVLQSSGRSRLGDERWDAARDGRVWLMSAEAGAAWVEITRDGAVRSGAVRLSE